MAEYYLSYADVLKFVEENINTENCLVSKYKAEILTAITGSIDTEKNETVGEVVSLWDNQILQQSELLLGTRYIRLNEVVLCFIEVALLSGLLDALIAYITEQPPSFSVSMSSAIVIAVRNLLATICSLENCDFCVYMQAVLNFKKHKSFSKEELFSWFPEENKKCNIPNKHIKKWDCIYCNDDGICNIIKMHKVESALESLCLKGILKKSMNNGQSFFKFEF